MLFALMFVFFVALANMGCGGGASSISNGNSTIAQNEIPIDEEHFWDYVFMEYVRMFDVDGDDFLNEAEIAAVTVIDMRGVMNYESSAVSQDNDSSITMMRGIEYFTALESLDCSENNLTELDLSNNTALKYLNCRNNRLTKLNLFNNTALLNLDCCSNQPFRFYFQI